MSALFTLPIFVAENMSISPGIVIIFFIIIVFYWKVVRVSPHQAKMLLQFNGPSPLPILGNVLDFLIPTHELLGKLDQIVESYGRIVKFWLGNQPYIFLSEAKYVEKILSSNVLIDKSPDFTNLLNSWLRTGLLTANGKKWFNRRKLLTPTFHFKILEDFVDIFNEQSLIFVGLLKKKAMDGKTFNIGHFITNCTLDILCETAMGKKSNAQTVKDSDYVKAVYDMGDILVHRFLRPWLHPNIIWKISPSGRKERKCLDIMHTFTSKVIAEKKSLRLQQKLKSKDGKISEESMLLGYKNRKAFLDLLLDMSDDGKVLTDSDIREETDTFMFEGHDTTSSNLSWILHLLATHPEIQAKVLEELDGIFGDDKDRAVTSNDMTQMKYLECCIKESLRVCPPVPLFARNIGIDHDLGDGKTILKGTIVFINTWSLHRDPAVFPDPHKFWPERWLESPSKRNPYAFIPFSAGSRNCIGQKFAMLEEKVILAHFFRNFEINTDEKYGSVRARPALVLRPIDGIVVKISKR